MFIVCFKTPPPQITRHTAIHIISTSLYCVLQHTSATNSSSYDNTHNINMCLSCGSTHLRNKFFVIQPHTYQQVSIVCFNTPPQQIARHTATHIISTSLYRVTPFTSATNTSSYSHTHNINKSLSCASTHLRHKSSSYSHTHNIEHYT